MNGFNSTTTNSTRNEPRYLYGLVKEGAAEKVALLYIFNQSKIKGFNITFMARKI